MPERDVVELNGRRVVAPELVLAELFRTAPFGVAVRSLRQVSAGLPRTLRGRLRALVLRRLAHRQLTHHGRAPPGR